MTLPTHADHVVVGGGAMGLAAAWSLVRAGHTPLVIDRFPAGHVNGASHGATRNFNDAYARTPYVDLLRRARDGWDDLGRGPDGPLLRLHGLVTHGDDAEIAAVRAAHASAGLRSEVLDAAEATRRWSGMRFTTSVLHSHDAGVVRADAALRELERRIVQGGGTVVTGVRVTGIVEDGDGVTVTNETGVVRADTVIVTAGAWARALVPSSVSLPPLAVTEETPAHFLPRVPTWPSFNHLLAGTEYPADVYGMPTPGEGVKVGFHGVGDVIDPDARPHRPTHQDALARYVREWIPGLDADSATTISCTYTSTPTGDFVLDRVGRIVVGAGFSGHGFKFVPAIGGVLADLALDPAASVDPLFRAAR